MTDKEKQIFKEILSKIEWCSDPNLTKIICPFCRNWCWDDENPIIEIKHSASCIYIKAKELIND